MKQKHMCTCASCSIKCERFLAAVTVFVLSFLFACAENPVVGGSKAAFHDADWLQHIIATSHLSIFDTAVIFHGTRQNC